MEVQRRGRGGAVEMKWRCRGETVKVKKRGGGGAVEVQWWCKEGVPTFPRACSKRRMAPVGQMVCRALMAVSTSARAGS